MKRAKAILYIHGKNGSAAEAETFADYCEGYDVLGIDFDIYLPRETSQIIRASYEQAACQYQEISILANSIGAYFSMLGLYDCPIQRALFISPVLDMEKLILTMMRWADVTEAELEERREIPTDFGETLSIQYLHYVRNHPVQWTVPTDILYASGDFMTSRATVDAFVKSHKARLTIMEHGEHWFHTPEQMDFLHQWLRKCLSVGIL